MSTFSISLNRLAVGPQVFVAVALGDLDIAVRAAHHQQLLELLRGLGQRVESARIDPAGDQIVSGAFRRRFGQNGRLDFDKAVFIIEIADDVVHLAAERQRLLHDGLSEIQIAVLQTQVAGYVVVVLDVDGRGLGLGVDAEFVCQDLHSAGLEVCVLAFSFAYDAFDAHGVFAAQAVGLFEHVRRRTVAEHDLHDALAVTDVRKDQAAEISLLGDPSVDGDLLTDQIFSHFAAIAASLQ